VGNHARGIEHALETDGFSPLSSVSEAFVNVGWDEPGCSAPVQVLNHDRIALAEIDRARALKC